jgi:hypothetical protein
MVSLQGILADVFMQGISDYTLVNLSLGDAKREMYVVCWYMSIVSHCYRQMRSRGSVCISAKELVYGDECRLSADQLLFHERGLLGGCVGSALGSIRGSISRTPLESGKSGIRNQDDKTKHLQSYRRVVYPISMLFWGLAMLNRGWWRLRNRNSWRDWGWGSAGMLIGWRIASFARGWFLNGIF